MVCMIDDMVTNVGHTASFVMVANRNVITFNTFFFFKFQLISNCSPHVPYNKQKKNADLYIIGVRKKERKNAREKEIKRHMDTYKTKRD